MHLPNGIKHIVMDW